MHTITLTDLPALITHVGVEQREPIMLWGQPGVGKSEGLAQCATSHNAYLVDIRLSQYDSVDLRGIPSVDESTSLTVWNAPSTLPFKSNPAFDQHELIFLFLDEINSAAPAVAAVAYQLINDRRVGEHVLRDNVVIVAAGNRESDRGITNRMPTPLANRFTHAEIGLDVDAFCFHAQSVGAPSEGIAFLQFRKPLLSTFIREDGTVTTDKAFATPRTWMKAFRYYASTMPQHIKQAAMAGAVGDGPAAEFWGFVDIWRKIIPLSQIEKDPTGTPLPDDSGMAYATAVNISGGMTAQNVGKLYQYLKRMSPEFVVLSWQLALKRDESLYSAKEYLDFAKTYRAVFQ